MARVKIDNYAVADAPRLGVRGWLRWIWRQVTSMRIALILLLLLALAAIPGSVLPQWPQQPGETKAFIDNNAVIGPVLDKLGFLDVFGSAWFTAIYVLLFASLIGCIVPRAIAHYKAMRAPVPAVPSSFARYEPSGREETDVDAATAIERARKELRPRAGWLGALTGYRIRVDERVVRDGAATTSDGKERRELAMTADMGHIRELGNLIFHISLVFVLIAVGAGTLLTYRGQAIIVEGRTFTNAAVAYDTFSHGSGFDPADLQPFTVKLDGLDAVFEDNGRPKEFTAHVTLQEPGKDATQKDVQVNRPLQVDGAKMYLQGNGYAPVFTYTDGDGNVAFQGPVVFLPQDQVYTSTGVVKVPDVTSGEQIGLKGTLLPTEVTKPGGSVSIHPDPGNPVIYFTAYTGDLGLDDGVPQNAYQLDESQLSPVRGDDGQPFVFGITLGDTVTLPDGLGTISFDALPRFAAMDLRADPSLPWLLAASISMLVGLAISLFATRRRIWLVAPMDTPTTVVEAAALAPSHDGGVEAALDRALAATSGRVPDADEEDE
ncbi:cytochrome c biogenesis protein ResB [Demequina aurantiaca]|uniref:cytochrome c biogenesis protein ResB n=1 Tax=Demequina aurantiaca TaxID=676200 RepID=UPI000781D7F9|nr:cytochrome c biogenesis protein ResB [Demequina aurantiaca]